MLRFFESGVMPNMQSPLAIGRGERTLKVKYFDNFHFLFYIAIKIPFSKIRQE
jgi:hypothetical protein